jgi:hypothetical protein
MIQSQEKPIDSVASEQGFPLTSDLKNHERCFSWTGTFAPVEYPEPARHENAAAIESDDNRE